MNIFVMRHGDAHLSAPTDMQRPLTEKGLQEVHSATTWLREYYFAQHTQIDFALVSPYLRTKQTFAKITESLSVSRTEYSKDVIPSASAYLTHDYIDTLLSIHQNLQSMLIVSHMPLVSYLLDELTQTKQTPLFATASIAVVNYDRDSCKGELVTHQQQYFA
jgi:phosphohistidine phosphatase